MSEIDWSKAPEGATHARTCMNWSQPDWYKVSNGVLMVVSCGDPWEKSGYSSLDELPDVQKRPSEAWLGTGLPPVGTVCEVLHKHEWVQCEVVAHKDLGGVVHAIVWIDADRTDQSGGIRLRQIRTQAQIEAEEREKACEEMLEIAKSRRHDPDVYEAIATLYDAGYRKQGEDK